MKVFEILATSIYPQQHCFSAGNHPPLKRKMYKPVAEAKSVTSDHKRIVWLWVAGLAARDIAKETGTSLSTVYRWIRRWEKEGTLETRSQCNRRIYVRRTWGYTFIGHHFRKKYFTYNVYANIWNTELRP